MPKAFAGAASNGMVKRCAFLRRNLHRLDRHPPMHQTVMQQTAPDRQNSGSRIRVAGFGSNLYIRRA
jgi:hypothetical protein